jgi:acetyl-CoA carboxylase beta subunit
MQSRKFGSVAIAPPEAQICLEGRQMHEREAGNPERRQENNEKGLMTKMMPRKADKIPSGCGHCAGENFTRITR